MAASGTNRFDPLIQAAEVVKVDIVDIGFQHVRCGLQDFLPHGDRCLVNGVAAHDRSAAGKRRDAPIECLGVAFDHNDVFGRYADLVGDDLSKHGVVSLTLATTGRY